MTLSLSKTRKCLGFLPMLVACLLTFGNLFSQNCPNLGNLTNYLFVFTNGSTDANWQGATKGYAGNVAIDGIQAAERTSGGVPFAGTIYTNDGTLGAWSNIVSQNSGQAFASTNQTSRIAGLEADLANAFAQINALSPSPGYSGVSSTSLNGLNTQNGIAQTLVINITSGLNVSTKINITGDANDCFVLRWDSDGNPNNGYQGQTKFQSGGAVVPLGGLKPSNFINVAGDINSSGGGANPPAPYPQGPRTNNGTGSLIPGASNFSGGGFFTGYWLTTGDPVTGQSSSMSNGIFVGGWYSSNSKFSMTSGTSGVYVAPNIPQLGSIGDRVFNDLNQNGIQDNGEPGVPNVPVQLKNCQDVVLQTVQTNGSGNYNFPNLAAGCYRVCMVLPNGFVASPQNMGGNDANDSDINSGGCTADINLSPGQNDPTQDAGIYQPPPQLGSIGDRVFNDLNQNGIQDNGETGVPNVPVQLKNCQDVVLQTMNTNASGNYNFPNLAAGCYRVCMVLPNGFVASPQNMGGNDANDSDISAGGCTADINLSPGQNDPTQDAGIFQPPPQLGSIGDRVFNDLNQNGIQDNGEPGVPNVPVQLKNCQDVVLQTVQTNGSGNYNFPNLAAGCYRVCMVLPNGFVASPQNMGGNDANDSDINAGGCTADINLSPGQNDPTNDAGIYQPTGSPCDNVTITATPGTITVTGLNGSPIAMVQVFNAAWAQVFNCAGNCTVPTQVVPNLPAGNYFVKVNLLNAAWAAICQKELTITVPPPGNLGSIGDRVFNDLNQNGMQDNGETGVPNVPVQLKNCQDVVLQTMNTNASGNYNFPNLAAGCYRVCMVLPNGFVASPQNMGGNDANDSDISAGGCTADINLSPGQNDPTQDAGIYQPTVPQNGSVGDKVWNDLNQNGVQDLNEPGVSGVRVRLFTCAGVQLQEKFTNGSGIYTFPNVAAGSYYVTFDLLPSGFVFTTKDAGGNDAADSDASTTEGRTDCFNLASGENKTTVDAGVRPSGGGTTASLGDFVWHDFNGNGCQDVGEMGIEHLWVGLYDNAGNFLQQQFTDSTGRYLFENLAPGTYKVKIAPPTGLRNSPRNACTNDANDSDIDDVNFTNFSDPVTLVAGQNYRDLDAGFESIPAPCTTPLTASASGVTCANGQATFTLLVTGGLPWGWNIANGNQFITGVYGVSKSVTLPVSGSSLSIIITDNDNPTCVTTTTINCGNNPPPPSGADLELTAIASPNNPGAWANTVLTFSLKNNGSTPATGVEVQLPAMSDAAVNSVLAYVAQNPPGGTTFNNWSGKWTVGNLAAGQTLNLGYTVFTKTAAPIPVFAQVSAQSPTDADSSPNNNNSGTPSEDDEARIVLNNGSNLLAPGDRKDVQTPDVNAMDDFTLFPNPAGEQVNVDLQAWQGKTVKLLAMNHLGKVVFEKQIDQLDSPILNMDLSDWQNGQYFIQLETPGQRKVVRKLAVMRMY